MNAKFSVVQGITLLECDLSKAGDWEFKFENNNRLSSSAWWRIVSTDRIILASNDHSQQFGLPEPIDARACVLRELGNSKVLRISIVAPSQDLCLEFENGKVLQILSSSSGYENWEFQGPELGSVIGRSHDIVEF